MVINPYIFKREPNTFIGGIAKLGGTGANAPILTAAELATTLGISESIIKGFKVVGEDVECRITKGYNIKNYAFGSMDGLSSNNNIIYFNDPDGRMKIGGRSAFSHCQNLESLIVTGVTEIGESFCNFNPKLETLIVTSLITAVNQPFDHNVKLKEFTALNLNNFTGASNFFFGNTDLHTVNTPEINRLGDNHYRECVSLTQIINDNALTAGFHIFRDCSSIELISIKKIKSMGSNAFTNIKTNCVINCNIFLRTSNMGDIDANLLHAYTSRNATINFYDDNGNFVETYNPNPELYTQNDACSIGANETESIGAGWSVIGDISMSVEESTQSDWCIKFMSTSTLSGNRSILVISGLEIGETYEISLDGRAEDATGLSAGQGFIRTRVSDGWSALAFADIDSFNWQRKSFSAVATATSASIEYYPSYTASGVQAGWSGFLDNISIKKISSSDPESEPAFPEQMILGDIDWEDYVEPTSYPSYLVPFVDINTGATVTRVSDESAFGLGDEKFLRHEYSRRPVWNSDGSLITLVGKPARILDGNTFELLGTTNNNFVWSNLNPLDVYMNDGNTVYIGEIDPITFNFSAKRSPKIFSEYLSMHMVTSENNLSVHDHMLLYGTKTVGGNLYGIVYDVPNDIVISEKDLGFNSSVVDWISMSKTGEFVAIRFKNSGSGSEQGVFIYDKYLNNKTRLTEIASHGDLGLDEFGNDVYVYRGSQILGYGYASIKLIDQSEIGLLKISDTFSSVGVTPSTNSGHISCTNILRNGWAYLTLSGSVNIGRYKPEMSIISVKLDGSGIIERWCTTNATNSDKYYHQPHGVSSPDGKQILFASDWNIPDEQAKIYTKVFVAKFN